MAAHYIPIGEPAHDNERQAIRYLVDGLTPEYTVYGNAWLVERSGVVYELDAVVVAPHAIYVVETKSYRGRIEGTDHDWYIPHPIPSPLKLNRLTAQVLKNQLRREDYLAGSRVWVQGLLFLSATTDVGVQGPASRDRVYTRKDILAALQDPKLVLRLSGQQSLVPTREAESPLAKILMGAQKGPRPQRQIREYEVIDRLSHQETYTELLSRNTLSDDKRLLRIYTMPPLASDAQRKKVEDRARWEAQVLGRLGRLEGVLSADPPFADEAGIVLPLEYFEGVTLTSWVERYVTEPRGADRAELRVRTDLWIRIAEILDRTHAQGVVHRILRPDAILVENAPAPGDVRVTGFDLAKQLALDSSISLTTIGDDRQLFAAPEVLAAFSSAEPASDQFSLGCILALLLTGRPLFESTRQLMAARRLISHIRDFDQRIPLRIDEAVSRMVELRPTDRFPTLTEAIMAVRAGREPESRPFPVQTTAEPRVAQDPENLPDGARIGPDYEVTGRLGQGGMAMVYAARHLPSGRTRALKIARPTEAAEEALRGEYQALSRLDHPNVVRVIDITKMVDGRLTLVMERVGGSTLRQWIAQTQEPEYATRRRLGEDLLAGLDYLEQQGVTHKDLKPDNLLVGDGRLTIIDFSLAGLRDDALYGGTALYRDPSGARWSHGTDRFAGALCLFELYAGRHAFDGHVPEPDQAPSIREEDIDPPGLAAFFRKALDPTPEKRFPSVRAMRDAFLLALGETIAEGESTPESARLEASTPLPVTSLSQRAINALASCQVRTVGQLLALRPEQVRTIHAIGTKTASDIIAFQESARSQGLAPDGARDVQIERPLVAALTDCPEALAQLALPANLLDALTAHGLPTIGALASLTTRQLLAIPGVGRKRHGDVVDTLRRYLARTPEEQDVYTLDGMWALASRPLTDEQRVAVERCVGLGSAPEVQGDIARDLGRSQPQVSQDCNKGLARLECADIAGALNAFEIALDNVGGIVLLEDLGRRFEESWPPGVVSGAGMVRLLVRVTSGTAQIYDVDGAQGPLVTRPFYDRDVLRSFCAEAIRLASQWPPVEPDTTRRSLKTLLPEYDGDALSLAVRVCDDIDVAQTGHLFIGPLDPSHSIGFTLSRARDPMPLEDLEPAVRRIFGPETPFPDRDHLLVILNHLDCQVQGDLVIPGRTRSMIAAPPLAADPVPVLPGGERTTETTVRDMLRDVSRTSGFRMLVVPPERHAEIARSVAQALGFTWLSFEDEFFVEHGARLPELERGERFAAQRSILADAAEETMFRLLEEHGGPEARVVLGDLALLGLCDALDLPRRVYDETLSGRRGFWVLVVPAIIYKRQPRFNEGDPLWHLEGATVPLLNPLPEQVA